jgi:hypothetical protein
MTKYITADNDCDKRQTRPLVRLGVQQRQDRDCQTVINIWPWAVEGARYQDWLTDWLTDRLTVSRNVTLTLTWLRGSLETVIRRVGGRCEMAASLLRRELGYKGTSTVGRRYQATQWRTWPRTLKCSHDLCIVACMPLIRRVLVRMIGFIIRWLHTHS